MGADKASAILVLQPEGKWDPGDAPQDFNSKAQVAATAMVLSSMPSNRTHEQHLVLHQAANIQVRWRRRGLLKGCCELPEYIPCPLMLMLLLMVMTMKPALTAECLLPLSFQQLASYSYHDACCRCLAPQGSFLLPQRPTAPHCPSLCCTA